MLSYSYFIFCCFEIFSFSSKKLLYSQESRVKTKLIFVPFSEGPDRMPSGCHSVWMADNRSSWRGSRSCVGCWQSAAALNYQYQNQHQQQLLSLSLSAMNEKVINHLSYLFSLSFDTSLNRILWYLLFVWNSFYGHLLSLFSQLFLAFKCCLYFFSLIILWIIFCDKLSVICLKFVSWPLAKKRLFWNKMLIFVRYKFCLKFRKTATYELRA